MDIITATSKRVKSVLGLDLHSWENAMVICLIIAGGFALAAGAATWAVVRLQRHEIAESKLELERYKIDSGKAIAEAVARAAEADHARVKLELLTKPRSISPIDANAMAPILPKLVGRKIAVASQAPDGEAESLALQVIGLLTNAGVKVENSAGENLIAGGPKAGIHIRANSAELLNAIRALLIDVAGLVIASTEIIGDAERLSWTGKESNEAIIEIGPRPIPNK